MFSMFSMFNMHVHTCVCVLAWDTPPDLKSVKNFPPMGGCVVWWVGGWLGGLMGGVRSNH